MGVFNKSWLQLLKSYGMNHNACMVLTRDVCRIITKSRIKLHVVRSKPEKTRRAAEKIKHREVLGTYIRKWYATLSHDRVEFSQYEMLTWKMRRKDKWVTEHKKTEHGKLLNKHKWYEHSDPAHSIAGPGARKNICEKGWRTSAHNPPSTPLHN
jgi:hypothetical protein